MNTDAHYDTYDYSTFWKGRDYEHAADSMVLTGLLKKATTEHKCIIDVGGGLGRLIPYYVDRYKKSIVLDPSTVQLKRIQAEVGDKYPTVEYAAGVAEALPFADDSADTILCVRVTHHIPDFTVPAQEFHRVLEKGGYLILEVANKIHFKARLQALRKGKYKSVSSADPIQVNADKKEGSIEFVNHHPKTLQRTLEQAGFEIVTVRSVSNFRSAVLKKYVPHTLLIAMERALQRPLASAWFGPSIYFLARKK
jgi:ubiquinone/menaquinone biosynthesis C-methylase UbiE